MGGAVCNIGLLLMTNCTFTGNFVTASNGGPGSICSECNPQFTGPNGAPGNALGGALANFGAVTSVSNTFLDNYASGPGADVDTIYGDIPGQLAPFVSVIPQSQVVAAGNSVTFSAIAWGWTDPTYQWAFDGTNLASATTTTLVLTNVQSAQSGTYWVEVLSSSGSETSAPVMLTVVTTPTITVQRQSNGNVVLRANSVPGQSFDFQASTNLQTWVDLGGAIADINGLVQFTDTNAPALNCRFYYLIRQ
jgi:hypothetical protein